MKTPEVKQLSLILNRRGATYKLVERGKKALVYARTVHEQIHAYDIFTIRIRQEGTINGKITPASEVFPHDEAFGIWAKCTYSIEKAFLIFEHYENSN